MPIIFAIYTQTFKHNQQYPYHEGLTVYCEYPDRHKVLSTKQKNVSCWSCLLVSKRYAPGEKISFFPLLLGQLVVKILLLNQTISIDIHLTVMSRCSKEKQEQKGCQVSTYTVVPLEKPDQFSTLQTVKRPQ